MIVNTILAQKIVFVGGGIPQVEPSQPGKRTFQPVKWSALEYEVYHSHRLPGVNND